jgi:hypothetical protein
MSHVTIRKLLEVRLNTVGGVFPTAFENAPFVPTNNVAWQSANLLPGQTENPDYGDSHHREVGVFQVTLYYPRNAGSQAALTRAELLRAGFARGLDLQEGSVKVKILRSPYIGPATDDDAWYRVPVSVPYTADVY